MHASLQRIATLDNYINAFYKQYDDFVINYNEKFAKPGVRRSWPSSTNTICLRRT